MSFGTEIVTQERISQFLAGAGRREMSGEEI
jgi:hypothetical protein